MAIFHAHELMTIDSQAVIGLFPEDGHAGEPIRGTSSQSYCFKQLPQSSIFFDDFLCADEHGENWADATNWPDIRLRLGPSRRTSQLQS